MKALTLRNVPREVQRLINKKAKEKRTSANKVVIELLEECTGTSNKKSRQLYHDLDCFSGAWSAGEAAAFEKALKTQREIDPELWK